MKALMRRYLTRNKKIAGVWTRTGPTTAEDSVLGACECDPDDAESFSIRLRHHGVIRVSLRLDDNPQDTYAYARSILVDFDRLDRWYRRFAAVHNYNVHLLMGPRQKVSRRQLAERLKVSWMQLTWPCSGGGVIWYSAGQLLGGARVAVVLDAERRYVTAAMG